MIERILPAGVAVAEAFADAADAVLFPAEEAMLAEAAPQRRAEFATGRACARAALARLGLPAGPIIGGPGGEPRWPDGVTGSITHCVGYRAAAAAWTEYVLAIGIDAEPDLPLPEGVLERIANLAERDHLAALGDVRPGAAWDRLLFCAKEAVYKAWYPLTRRWLGFAGAKVTLDPERGTFTASLLTGASQTPGGMPVTGFSGRWLVGDGLILAAVSVPADGGDYKDLGT